MSDKATLDHRDAVRLQIAEELRDEAKAAPTEMASGAFAGLAYAVATGDALHIVEWLVISDEKDLATAARWIADRLDGTVPSDGEQLPPVEASTHDEGLPVAMS